MVPTLAKTLLNSPSNFTLHLIYPSATLLYLNLILKGVREIKKYSNLNPTVQQLHLVPPVDDFVELCNLLKLANGQNEEDRRIALDVMKIKDLIISTKTRLGVSGERSMQPQTQVRKISCFCTNVWGESLFFFF